MFDYAEDIDLLRNFLPKTAKGLSSIIITTQDTSIHQVTTDCRQLTVENFDTSEGATLLFRYQEREAQGQDEREAAEQISGFVDGLPLAVACIGIYLKSTQSQMIDFLPLLRKSSSIWTARTIRSYVQYEQSLGTAFDYAISQLSERARRFLHILAFFDTDYIPEEFFKKHFQNPTLQLPKNEDE